MKKSREKRFSTISFRDFLSLSLILCVFSALSACEVGSSLKPEPSQVEVTKLQLLSYDQSKLTLKLIGQLRIENVRDENPLQFFANADCKGTPLGQGNYSQFKSDGILLELESSKSTSIYMSGVSFSGCYFITEYKPEFEKPKNPVFRNSVPTSPSRESYAPVFYADHELSGIEVRFFSDSQCSAPLSTTNTEVLAETGYRLLLTRNSESSVYVQSIEPFGLKSDCELFTKYLHADAGPTPPVFSSSEPVSPSRVSRKPLLKGAVGDTAVQIRFFSDMNCSLLLKEVDAASFKANGVEMDLPAETQTKIYSVALDAESHPSTCELFTIYEHDSVAPGDPTYSSADPSTPTRLSIYPKLKGALGADAALIKFFKNQTCTEQIGSGSRHEFVGAGATAGVAPNSTTEIYGQAFDAAGNSSSCVFLVSYRHNTIAPDPPVFASTDPQSPNNFSTTPRIFGNAAVRSVEVFFYSDDHCTQLIGSGPAEDYDNAGIPLVLPDNSITTIHATARDEEGNISSCAVQANYAHSTLPAPAPGFFMAVPASPTRLTNEPYIIGTAAATVTRVDLYTNSSCTTHAGGASRIIFISSGVKVTVPINAITDLYAVSADVYGNFSACTLLTTYTHNIIPPFNPTYTGISPTSPNNFSVTPTITGGTSKDPLSVLDPLTVSLYDSFLCLNRIGTSAAGNFSAGGILLGVPENTVTTIYGRVFDAAGNQSACTYLTDYIHSNLKPGRPQFAAALPATPSYTATTKIRGAFGTTQDFLPVQDVSFYSNSTCTNLLITGTPTDFLGSGIELTVPLNAITSIYGQARNVVSTKSDCHLLVNYRHTDVGATNLSANVQPDGSINLSWTPDLIASPTAKYQIKRALQSGGPYSLIQSEVSGSSFRDRSISYGSTYFYRLAATNNTGVSLDTAEVSATVNSSTPDKPISLVAVAGASSVTLSWVGFPVNMFYRVLRSTNSGGPYSVVAQELTTSNYTDTGLTNNTAYYYKVVGTNTRGLSIESDEANAFPLSIPAAPTGLSVTPVAATAACGGARGVLLAWSPTSHYQSFNVKRGYTGNPQSNVANVTTTFYTDCWTGAAERNYSVTAVWGAAESANSNSVEVDGDPPPNMTAYGGNNQVILSWAPITSIDLSHYQVERALGPNGPFTTLAPAVYSNSYIDATAVNGTAYFYRMTPHFGWWSGTGIGYSTLPVSAIPQANPSAPTNLKLLLNDAGLPQLQWSNTSYANGYRVYRSSTSGGPYTEINFSATASYTDTSPLVGMNYYIVRTAWGIHNTAATNEVSYRRGDISSLTATATSSSIDLSWPAVTGASGYSVYRGTAAGGPYGLLTTVGSNSFSDTGAVAGVGYFYVVRANFADFTQGKNSSEASGMRTTTNVPSGLTITASTTTSLTLKWARVTGASKYNVYQSTTSGSGFTLVNDPSSNSLTIGLLSPSTRYYFRVNAVVSGNPSANSNEVSGYTYAIPAAPTVQPGLSSVTLSWSSMVGATSYTILRSTDGENFSILATGVPTISHTDNTAVNGTLYFYKVVAVYPPLDLTSPASLAVTPGAVPMIPSGLQITANSTGTDVELGFSSVPQATGYVVSFGTTSGGPYPFTLNTTSTTGNILTGLTAGATHYAVVKALIGTAESANSAQISFVPDVTPIAPEVFSPSGTQVDVTWTAVAGAASYRLERTRDGEVFTIVDPSLVTTSFADTTVVSGESYNYRFIPIAASGAEFATSALSLRVSPGILPNAPVSVRAEATSTPSVKLFWVSTSNTNSYRIYRSPAGAGTYALMGEVLFPAITYEDTTAVLGVSYDYVVRSVSPSRTESLNSNVASVTLTSAPGGLVANATNSLVSLSWNPVAGATHYTVYRSVQSGVGYGVLAGGVLTESYADTNILNGITYYYKVVASFADGSYSLPSSEVSAVAIRTLNLEVPVELIDRGLSSKTNSILFMRSSTSIDTTAYDGTVAYFLEIQASSNDVLSRDVEILDQNSNVLGLVTVPALTSNPTRFRSLITAPTGNGLVRLRLPGTSTDGDLSVYSARLLVQQSGATKTKIYVPLLSSQLGPSSEDELGFAEESVATSSTPLVGSGMYKRALAEMDILSLYNPLELEVVARRTGSAEGQIGLRNISTGTSVGYSELFLNSDGWKFSRNPFGTSATGFTASAEGQFFQIAAQCNRFCTTGALRVYRAGLWIKIDQLTRAVIPYRLSGLGALSANSLVESHRVRLDLSMFTTPVVHLQTVASTASLGFHGLELVTHGLNDSGVGGASPIAGSLLDYSGSAKTWARSPALTVVSDERFGVARNSSSGVLDLLEALLVVKIGN